MKLLVINASPDLTGSVTRTLVSAHVARLSALHPDLAIVQRDVGAEPVPHLPAELAPVQTGASPPVDTPANDLAETLIAEIEAADVIVLGVPMYNFTVPSSFKAWIDHVIRAGRTFTYSGGVPAGLVSSDKKVVVFASSGGVYTSGPAQPMDFLGPYLTTLFGFIGLTDVTIVRAEAQGFPDQREVRRRDAVAEAEALAA